MSFISIRHLWKEYDRRVVLENISLDFERGEFVSIVGASGCGKTTFFKMLLGEERPTRGTMLLNGKPWPGEPGADRGVVFQGHDSLYDWLTALDNIAFGLRLRGLGKSERHAKAEHYLKMVGLTGQGAKHPSELSGGMKQRIQIARALANDPRILLADEPTGNLDTANGLHVMELLADVNRRRGTTLVLATHDRELASRADERVALRDGRREVMV